MGGFHAELPIADQQGEHALMHHVLHVTISNKMICKQTCLAYAWKGSCPMHVHMARARANQKDNMRAMGIVKTFALQTLVKNRIAALEPDDTAITSRFK